MNYKAIIYMLGRILIIVGLLLLLPLIVSAIYLDRCFVSFAIPAAAMLAVGGLVAHRRPENMTIYAREGIIICGLAWIIMSALGALPFFISGSIPNYLDAFFETVSGFTTTGSSILKEVESLPKSILFWRSFTHWIGGMGILVFMIAVIPKSEGTAMNIMKAEVPGPKAGKVVSKIRSSARILYIIYLCITLIQIILLCLGGMPLFDSMVSSFATAGTGGFSVLNASIGGYHSVYSEWVIIIFMFLFGVNFNMYYYFLIRKFSSVFKDEEFLWYIIINVSAVVLITVNISGIYPFWEAVRNSFFNVNSVMSTTGFCTVDFNRWPTFSKCILTLLMFIGCSAGSTGGGLKVSRVLLYIKEIKSNCKQIIHPHSVNSIKMNDRPVERDIQRGLNAYLCLYVAVLITSILIIAIDGFDLTTTFTSVISCFNNIGPGLGMVGPTGNYSIFSPLSKIVLSVDMLAGRLELYPILLLLAPSTWKHYK